MFSPARRADARAQRARRAELQAPRLREPAQRHRQRVADAASEAKAFCPPLNISPDCATRSSAPPCSAAAARPPRRGRLGLCPRRRRHGRRHHPELRGDRLPARTRTARVAGVETTRGDHRAPTVGVVTAGHTSVVMAHGGRAHADRELPAAGAGLRAGQAGLPLRGDVERGARLHQPVRQGRARHRRRHRPVRLLLASGRPSHHRRTRWTRICELFPQFSRMRMMRSWGGIVDVTPDRSPIIGKTPVDGPLRQLRLGHRRLQGDAGLRPRLRPHDRERASRTRSTRRSRSTASAPAAHRRSGAAAVAH